MTLDRLPQESVPPSATGRRTKGGARDKAITIPITMNLAKPNPAMLPCLAVAITHGEMATCEHRIPRQDSERLPDPKCGDRGARPKSATQ